MISRRLSAALIALLALSLAVTSYRLKRSHEARYSEALRADSVEAALDTTRERTRELAEVLGDRVRFFERRVIQTQLERDSLDRALDRTSRVRASLEARVDSLTAVSSSTVQEDSLGTRSASWSLREAPYEVQARAVLPPPPDSAVLDLTIDLDPLFVDARITCGDREAANPASLSLVAPEWATVQVREVYQDPRICNPPESSGFRTLLKGAAGGITIAALFSLLR